jgi:hypothetical protein
MNTLSMKGCNGVDKRLVASRQDVSRRPSSDERVAIEVMVDLEVIACAFSQLQCQETCNKRRKPKRGTRNGLAPAKAGLERIRAH